MSLIFSPESGEAIVGSERVSLVPVGDDGSVRIYGHSGSVIRPLRFGERTRLLIDAMQSDDPPVFCSDLLVHAATNTPPDVLTSAEKALALLLAGCDIDAPPLSRTITVVAGSTGWPLDIINTKTALEIDRIALDLVPRHSDWEKIVFPRQGADVVEAMIGEFITGLLRRVDEQIIQTTRGEFFQTETSNAKDRLNQSTNRNPFFGQERFSPASAIESRREPTVQQVKRPTLSIDPFIAAKSHYFREFKNAPGIEGRMDGTAVKYRENTGSPSSVLRTANQRSESFQQADVSAGDRRYGKKEAGGKENLQAKGDDISSQTNKNLPNENMKDLVQRLQLFPHPPVRRTSPGFGPLKSGSKAVQKQATAGGYDGKSENGFRNQEPMLKKELGNFPKITRSEEESWTDIPPILPAPGNRIDPLDKDFPLPPGTQQKSSFPENAVWKGNNPGQNAERLLPRNTISKLKDTTESIFPVSYTVIPVEDTNKKQGGKNTASAFDTLDLEDLADGIGRLLSAEADLRGID